MIKYIYLILFIPILLLSQDDLRIETIDVVKEYDPSIVLGKKISSQPIFNDTLSNEVAYSSKIMNLELLLNEFIAFDGPVRLRLRVESTFNLTYRVYVYETYHYLLTRLARPQES